MDIAFEIYLPVNATIQNIKFEQPVFQWQGVGYPQGTEEANYHYFKLKKTDVPGYVLRQLPFQLQNHIWQCISLTKGLDDFVNEYNYSLLKQSILSNLLSELLLDQMRWFIVIEPNYDCELEVLKGNVEIAIDEIGKSLFLERKGLLIWYENTNNHSPSSR
jgi:hypothetical protein